MADSSIYFERFLKKNLNLEYKKNYLNNYFQLFSFLDLSSLYNLFYGDLSGSGQVKGCPRYISAFNGHNLCIIFTFQKKLVTELSELKSPTSGKKQGDLWTRFKIKAMPRPVAVIIRLNAKRSTNTWPETKIISEDRGRCDVTIGIMENMTI